MSNLPSSPGSRPLEQLKVAELRDELKKRGMSIKGVKKELFERLEEAIKKEELEGIVHVDHGATQEEEHNSGTRDETEDLEGQDDALDGDVPKSQDTVDMGQTPPTPITNESTPLPESQMDVCRSDTSPILINTESTPILETQALSGVSPPDGVPGFNEDREPTSTAGVENVETNNDVLFVDNAVCGNGDTTVLPENVPVVADVLEPGKEAGDIVSDEGHAQGGNQETGPVLASDSSVSDLAVGQIVETAPESSFISGNIVSDRHNPPMENGDPHLAADNVMSENDVSGNNSCMDDVGISEVVNLSLETESKPLSPTSDSGGFFNKSQEVIGLKTESLSVSSYPESVALQSVNEAPTDLKSKELEGPIADEREMIINEERFNVGERDKTANEEKLDVKVEPMETDTAPEDTEVIREVGKKLQIDTEVSFRPKSPSEEAQLKEGESEKPRPDYAQESRGAGSASRVPDDSSKDILDDVGSKPVQDDSQAHVNLKRKDDDMKPQEPAKRMRRWNPGSRVAGDALNLKPLTTDTVKEIVLPESAEGSAFAAQKLTPRATTSRLLPPKVKAELESSSSPRSVPPSTRAPSDSLKIERFVRPFTLKAVKDLLAEFGQCVDFWMDQIKTHCFVTYSSVNEAAAARGALYGRQWPPSVGNFLTAEFVDANEVKIRSAGLSEKAQAAPATALLRVTNAPPPPPPRLTQTAPSFRSDLNTLPPSRFSREGQLPPAPKKDPEPTVLTLEDLFCKTKAKPHIYYLPLTEEQVAERIKNKQATR